MFMRYLRLFLIAGSVSLLAMGCCPFLTSVKIKPEYCKSDPPLPIPPLPIDNGMEWNVGEWDVGEWG